MEFEVYDHPLAHAKFGWRYVLSTSTGFRRISPSLGIAPSHVVYSPPEDLELFGASADWPSDPTPSVFIVVAEVGSLSNFAAALSAAC